MLQGRIEAGRRRLREKRSRCFHQLCLYFESEKRRLFALLNDHLIFGGSWPGFSLFSLVLPRLSLLQELEDRARRTGGVTEVRSGLVDEHIDRTRWFADHLASLGKGGLPEESVRAPS